MIKVDFFGKSLKVFFYFLNFAFLLYGGRFYATTVNNVNLAFIDIFTSPFPNRNYETKRWYRVGRAVENHRKECFKSHRNIIQSFRQVFCTTIPTGKRENVCYFKKMPEIQFWKRIDVVWRDLSRLFDRKHPRATCTKERHQVFLWPSNKGSSSFLCTNRCCI